MKKITIVGGGTAGWLSALFFRKFHPNLEVTLIESSKIGTIGVGEGTTPNIQSFLRKIDIDKNDFLEKTNATKKIGIDFINWPGDGSNYLHDFFVNGNMNHAYHFQSDLIGNYLKNIGISRNVTLIDDEVVSFDKTGNNITKIYLKTGDSIDTEFVIDCSGFSRLVLGKELGGEWISHQDDLTLNTALTFHLPLKDGEYHDTETFTRTKAIAMDYGWMWNIPLQNRWGCGYVYDNNHITNDEAKDEITKYFNQSIQFNKTINFECGYFKDVWIGNTIAIGLSGGFFEPIEATSIMTITSQLLQLAGNGLESYARDGHNKFMKDYNQQVFSFIKYHYVCDKNNTKFWDNHQKNNLPNRLNQLLDSNRKLKVFQNDKLKSIMSDNDYVIFDVYSYAMLSAGNFKKNTNLLL